MGSRLGAGCLLAFLLGYSTAFHTSLPDTSSSKYLTHTSQNGGSSTLVGARPSARSVAGASGVLQATVEDASRTTSAFSQDEMVMTPSEEAAVEWPYDWRKQLRRSDARDRDEFYTLSRLGGNRGWSLWDRVDGWVADADQSQGLNLSPCCKWYSVGYECDFPKGEKPFGVTIFDEPMVLFRDGDGILHCVSDFCPHRASKLSEGMVTDGNIECLYHGWQFDGKTGSCVHVPQLPEGAKPPRAANLRVYPLAIREGIVYVWMGDDPWGEGAKDILPVPCTEDDLDKNKPGFTYKFVIDLPYDWSYLTENLLDPAHIPISHHATEGGGDRSQACPISFEVVTEGPKAPSPRGFSAKVLNPALVVKGSKRPADYRFEAPGIIYLRSPKDVTEDEPADEKQKPGMLFGAQLHNTPLGRGRSRLLFNTYALNVPPVLKLLIKMKPNYLRHLNSCKVLEQDVGMICAQEDHVARTGQSLADSFLPIKSSDGMVVELRKWLDHVGHGMPHYTGWKTSKLPVEQLSDHETTQAPKHRARQSRFYNHVVLSECTRTALKNVIRVKRASLTAAGILAAAALLISCTAGAASPIAAAGATAVGGLSKRGLAGIATAVGGAVALGLGAAAQKFEGHFYKNFERHPVLV